MKKTWIHSIKNAKQTGKCLYLMPKKNPLWLTAQGQTSVVTKS